MAGGAPGPGPATVLEPLEVAAGPSDCARPKAYMRRRGQTSHRVDGKILSLARRRPELAARLLSAAIATGLPGIPTHRKRAGRRA